MAWGRWSSDCHWRHVRALLSSLIGLGVHLDPAAANEAPLEQLTQSDLLARMCFQKNVSCTPAVARRRLQSDVSSSAHQQWPDLFPLQLPGQAGTCRPESVILLA